MQTRRLGTETPALQALRFERMREWDRACAILLNSRLSPAYEKLWITVDRLGDSGPWLVFILTVALIGGREGVTCAIHMLAAGGLAVALYKIVKTCIGRQRPCMKTDMVRPCVQPLDEFSFPSGHTLHAVVFSFVALAYFPALACVLVPFVLLTAVSRVALGLHYPSDVFAGAAIGAGVALISFVVF